MKIVVGLAAKSRFFYQKKKKHVENCKNKTLKRNEEREKTQTPKK